MQPLSKPPVAVSNTPGRTRPIDDVFLCGHMLGCAAEIDDHLNRGKNMDTRTPQSEIRFVA
ncbi:MAG TPA: hypothetical protein VKG21_05680 [Casimicrobiaceae bacterium]|nr:hypothetical protein [Casimicrobiaceae bacterium]